MPINYQNLAKSIFLRLNQMGDAINDDASFAASVTASLANKFTDCGTVTTSNLVGNYPSYLNVIGSGQGSGAGGAVKRGDVFTMSGSGSIGNATIFDVDTGDEIRALVDNPGYNTDANWQFTKGRSIRSSYLVLPDTSVINLNPSLGTKFRLAATGDRTIQIEPTTPSAAKAGVEFIIAHLASGGARTLTLATGTENFRFGSDITGLTATASGKTDYIRVRRSFTGSQWDVVDVKKGY